MQPAQRKIPHPRTPRSDPSKSQRVGQSRENEDRQRREQESQRDRDPVGERSPVEPHEDEI